MTELFGDHPSRGQFHRIEFENDRVIATARTPAAAARLPHRALTLNAVNRLLPAGLAPTVLELSSHSITITRLPGAPLRNPGNVPNHVADHLVGDLAAFLRTLRDANVQMAQSVGIETAPYDHWSTFADDVGLSLYPLMSEAGRAKASRELDLVCSLPAVTDSLVHGDLGGDNLLFEERDKVPRLSGVVDWDSVQIGDQANDLASLAATFGLPIAERIVSRMGLNASLLPRISKIRGTFALQQALAGYHDGDEAEMQDGLGNYT